MLLWYLEPSKNCLSCVIGGPAQLKYNLGIGYPSPACKEELQKKTNCPKRNPAHLYTHTHTQPSE